MFNQVFKIAGVGIASTLALAVSASNAQAFDFTFSFDNVDGNVPNTVEGRIEGLADNTANQTPSAIIITDFPAGLGGSFNEGNDVVAWTGFNGSTSFDVFGGEITAANVTRVSSGSSQDVFCLGTNPSNCGADNYLSLDGNTSRVWNNTDFAGATYSAAATSVPFGVSTDLSLLILGGMYGASRLRKKLASK